MAYNFLPCDRDQTLLMPPDLREWLPENHLVWFVIDSVAELDLGPFYARYREDGWGRAAYEPAMMVALLLYAYASGVRSAREMERRCSEDVAFRVITANQVVDHATICRFRTAHREALGELFVAVLELCSKAGMVRPEVVAIDGTKLAANASAKRNLTREQLEDYARVVFEEAERIDAHEDELYGEGRGDEIPEPLRDRAARLRWLKERLAEIDAQHRAEEEARAAKRAARERELGRPLPGPRPKKKKTPSARVNATDPDSRMQKAPGGFVQGYNGQLAVTPDQIIVAADLVPDNNDVGQLEPMLDQVTDNLKRVEPEASVATVVADAGYFSEDNTLLGVGPELLIAPVKSRDLKEALAARTEAPAADPGVVRRWKVEYAMALRAAHRRKEVMEAYVAHLVTAKEAALDLGVSIQTVYSLAWSMRTTGYLPWAELPPQPPAPPPDQIMLERFAQPGALETYRLRAQTVEPVIGQLKEVRGLRRFLHRGLGACRSEFRTMAAAHNLRKLWRQRFPHSLSFATA